MGRFEMLLLTGAVALATGMFVRRGSDVEASARVRPATGAEPGSAALRGLASPGVEAAHVVEILPAQEVVPANLLRCYIEFSEPMQRGQVGDAVRVVGTDGRAIKGAFLRIGHELWSSDMRHLTLLFDPGRLKDGVGPREEVGAPLREGERYTLVIDPMRTASGAWSAAAHRRWRVGPADRRPPEPTAWELHAPRRGSREELWITADSDLDPRLGLRYLRIEDERRAFVPGRLRVDPGTPVITFVPDEPWAHAGYRLVVHWGLEDFAGNQVSAPFERSVATTTSPALAASRRRLVVREFQTRSWARP